MKLIHDLLKDWDGEVIRLALLKAHYRSELLWTEDLLKESKAQLDGAYRFLSSFRIPKISVLHPTFLDDLKLDGVSHLLSSLGPGGVLAHGLENVGNAAKALKVIGLLQKDPEGWFKGGLDYDALVAEYDSVRAKAIAAKEVGDKAKMGEMFKRSDEIRDQFKAEGVVIESGAGGKSSWRKA